MILGIMADAEPGTIYTYGDLTEALSEGTDREIDERVVGRAVRGARGKMLDLHQRTTTCVPTVGYRVAKASEHKMIAVDHRRRSERQMSWAVQTLNNVRWNEMDENSRLAHEAQITIMASMHQALKAIRSTQNRHERILKKLVKGEEAGSED